MADLSSIPATGGAGFIGSDLLHRTQGPELRGIALATGTILIMFDLVADVDPDPLDLVGQTTYPLAALGVQQVT